MSKLVGSFPVLGLFASMAFLPGNAALAFALGVALGIPTALIGLKSFGPPATPAVARDAAMSARIMHFAALVMLAGAGWAGFKLNRAVDPSMISVFSNVIGTTLALAIGFVLQARRFAV